MARKAIELLVETSPAWVLAVLADFDAFLADHANCERKASALAMGLIVKYPDREAVIPALIGIAREELEHFEQVHTLMRTRGIQLVRDSRDAYVAALLEHARHGRDARFLDRLLLASIVECRGAERFGLVAEALDDPALAHFYDRLRKGELKHGHVFADLALRYFDTGTVYARLHELAELEATIVQTLPARAALH